MGPTVQSSMRTSHAEIVVGQADSVRAGETCCFKNGRPMKVAAAFLEPGGTGNLAAPWPKELGKRVEVLRIVIKDPGTLLALYARPPEGGDFGYVANTVKLFYVRSGIVVRCKSVECDSGA
jgi:hypothetical protein